MVETGKAKKFQMGTGILPAPRGAFWWGLGGYILTAIIGFVAVANFEWTTSTYVVDEFFYANRSPFQEWLADILRDIDREDVVAVILLVMGVLVTLRRGWLAALGSMIVAGAGWLLIAGIKLVVAQPRPMPFEGPAYKEALSYPSGHVTFVMALTVAVCVVLAGTRWRWPVVIFLCLIALATGWSRLMLGVHYPMDIVGGMLGGLSGAFMVLGVWNWFIGLVTRKRREAP
jgi:membrane-associated phospholipid phosphatase